MDIKNYRRFLLTTITGSLAFFGIKKIAKIFDNSPKNNDESVEGQLVIKPHQYSVNRKKGGKL